jgi:hypothetical protein
MTTLVKIDPCPDIFTITFDTGSLWKAILEGLDLSRAGKL